jgi:hypothetical protein
MVNGISDFKVCMYELGDGSLTPRKRTSIRLALDAEVDKPKSINVGLGDSPAPSHNRAQQTLMVCMHPSELAGSISVGLAERIHSAVEAARGIRQRRLPKQNLALRPGKRKCSQMIWVAIGVAK